MPTQCTDYSFITDVRGSFCDSLQRKWEAPASDGKNNKAAIITCIDNF
jgi:hypothetical protein